MAKNNNLTDFLTDVADAIRSKKGTTEKINPQDFSSEIASIETGGGSTGGVLLESDVNFYDYDGILLHSYTKDDFLSLSSLPDLPTRKGLICQEWNYTLDKAKKYVTDYGVLDIGATYITDDGKTRLYIKIAAKGRMTVPLYFSQSVANGVTIDWGDGSETQTLSGTGYRNTSHTYDDIGEYVISLEPVSGCHLELGSNNSSYCVLGAHGTSNYVYTSMLRLVEIGSNVGSITKNAFRNCGSLSAISIPRGVSFIRENAFWSCCLSSVVIPYGLLVIEGYAFNSCDQLSKVISSYHHIPFEGNRTFGYCYSLLKITLPDSSEIIPDYFFTNCSNLKSITIPNGVTSIGNYAFDNCTTIQSITIPDSVTSIGDHAFYYCYALAILVLPSGLSEIKEYAFSGCPGIMIYDFSNCLTIPTLASSNAFNNIASGCKMVVPDFLYNLWITATNWSTHASRIVKRSEFNG